MRVQSRRAVAFALVVGGVFAAAVHGQGGTPDPALKKAAEARTAARYAGDAETYARYILDDATFINAAGGTDSKATRVKAVAGVKRTTPLPKVSDEQYRLYGDTAIRTWREDDQAPQRRVAQRWIEVWMKQRGEWKLAALQFTTIAKP